MPPMPSIQILARRLWRPLRVTVLTTIGCAWLYSTIYRESFAKDLVYALVVVCLTQTLIAAGRHGLAFWLRRRYPDNLDARRNWPGWGLMAPWVIVSVVIGYLAGVTLVDLLTQTPHTPIVIEPNLRMLLLSVTVAVVPAICITYFFYARSRMASMETRTQAALRSAAENQLKLLEAQLEPHMLFNTLANLRVLIGSDPLRAQGMLDHLIAYLRATLAASRSGSHPLASEFERISDYLQLMQIRMGSRLHIQLDLPASLADAPLPPLLLQPLVENAIKHGLEPKVRGGRVHVAATRGPGTLTLSVRDTGVGLDARPEHGARFGLQQVRERLATLYGAAGHLDLSPAADDEGGTLATVTLPYSRSSTP
ncbi:Histidine kinase [Paraburkholderia fungorum]|uniref:Histidine kinase n=2 Tax=Paraburkholderia fungorum TaxID=134537 RepID=A0A1H1H7L0_9BURK|nr:Histidine kinase [Paraburkholderia fungorum]